MGEVLDGQTHQTNACDLKLPQKWRRSVLYDQES